MLERFSYFCSKEGLDIKNLGKRTIQQLLEEKIVSTPSDLFKLSKEDFMSLERLDGFGEKKARTLYEDVQRAKTPTLSRFITALGIPLVGKQMSDLMANEFNSVTR